MQRGVSYEPFRDGATLSSIVKQETEELRPGDQLPRMLLESENSGEGEKAGRIHFCLSNRILAHPVH